MMEPIKYFIKYIDGIEPLYTPEELFSKPFYEFENRFNSLYRHWQLNKDYISSHISIINKVKEKDYRIEFDKSHQDYTNYYDGLGDDIKTEEVHPDEVFYDGTAFDVASDNAQTDIDYFPEYLRLSTVSFALSLVENFLGNLSAEIAEDMGVNIKLDEREIPYIDKHILWLTRGCGINITIDKPLRKRLNAIREIRNRFIHRIDRDIPDEVLKVISEMVSGILDDKSSVTNEFVDVSLHNLATLIKNIELAHIAFREKQNG
jgi:hypothetical protein